MAKIFANRYEIIRTIGHGGMAEVYLALDRILNREVAIKVLKSDMSSDPISLERFNREANGLTKLSHPNVVDIYDVGDENDQHYIVMEYVKGYTLKQLLQRRGAIPPREAVWMTKQLAGALMEAHKNGLIHRDIKSQNVLIKDDGTVKLADFGIAILNNAMQLTSKDSVLGSVHYLAPELAKGENASMQSDIYSLGIVFYELLTGDVPFKGDTPVQIALKQIKEPLPDVRRFNPQIPQSVVNVLTKATAKDPKNRYENIALMLRDLNTCLDQSRKNEQPINLKSKDKNFDQYNISANSDSKKSSGVQKGFSTLLIISITLISIIAISVIIILSGIFNKNDSLYTTVPDVIGLTQVSATDVLVASDLQVEYPVKRVLTKDIDAELVVGVSPDVGSNVEKGLKIKLIVSDGKFSVMKDYIGWNIEDAKNDLNLVREPKINPIENDEEKPGTIIAQKGIEAGEDYDPSTTTIIEFDVAYPSSKYIPPILGKPLDDAIEILDDENIKYTVEILDKEELNEFEINRYKPFEICRCDPEEGSLYYKSGDNSVTLYYYEEKGE